MSQFVPSKDKPLVIRLGDVEVDSTDRGFAVKVNGKPLPGVREIRISGGIDRVWSCEVEFMPSFTPSPTSTEPQP